LLSLFSNSRNDRVALAKSKYFEEGVLPTGTVPEHIFQSWMRCYRSGALPNNRIEFQPVSASRSQLSIQKNRALHEAWLHEQVNLLPVTSSSSCSVVLTDPTGVLIGLTPSSKTDQKIIPVAHRVGISLAEDFVGTTAPGLVARTGMQACVLGAEHYFDSVKEMFCVAAPIRGIDGKLAGILDISSEAVPFSFDPASVIGAYASSIENRLLVSQAANTILLKFQFLQGLMNSPMVGIMGVDQDGDVLWVNSVASSLLRIPFECNSKKIKIEEIFDFNFNDLLGMIGKDSVLQRLVNGFSVYLCAEVCEKLASEKSLSHTLKVDDGMSKDLVSDTASTSVLSRDGLDNASIRELESFRDSDAELIKKYLLEYKGNISKVAKRLKVSRGLIYRRIQEFSINISEWKSTS
jgi:sigma-54 dependent transcriptional regulator, acetoin dehydrogenase operon transcriptional activator AcoR